MDLERRVQLVKEVGEEIVTEDELRALLAEKAHPIAYDGFEPSGTIHIAQGVLRAINVNKMTRAGVRFKMFVADWHAWANNKMGGDLDKIQTTGRYITEIWKATGMDLANVQFVWASELVQDEAYWKKVMNIARDSSLDRILRTTQIMGRSEKDKLSAAQILYPCMQAADIFHLEADITQLGMDQRKVNMLAREVGPKLGLWKPVVVSHHMLMGLQQPPAARGSGQEIFRVLSANFQSSTGTEPRTIAVIDEGAIAAVSAEEGRVIDAHRLEIAAEPALRDWASIEVDARKAIPSLRALPETIGRNAAMRAFERVAREFAELGDRGRVERQTAMKMSKSNPDTAIFMTDSPEQVQKKMNKAFCPEKVVDENPVMEYYRYIIFQRHWADHRTAKEGESPVTIERPDKFGGIVTYAKYAELAADYAAAKIHPADLKKTAAKYINDILQPVREHFGKHDAARALKEQVESFKVTR